MTELRARAARRPWPFWVGFLLKASVTIGLVSWLVFSGTLDLTSLSILVESPKIVIATLSTWVLVAVVLSTLRWRFILRASGLSLPYRVAAVRQVTALFFNSVVPGNVGGDVLKNFQVFRGKPGAVVVAALTERAIGLVGLLWVGAIAGGVLALAGDLQPALLPLVVLVASAALVCALAACGGWWLSTRSKQPPSERPSAGEGLPPVVGKGLVACKSALSLFEDRPSDLLRAGGVSLVLHAVHTLYFLMLTRQLGNPGAELAQVAAIYPVGMLTLAIPVSLSGLGVGHVAFEHLFRLLTLEGGANVFNVFIVGALAPSLVGAIPFVLFKGGFLPSDASDSAQT